MPRLRASVSAPRPLSCAGIRIARRPSYSGLYLGRGASHASPSRPLASQTGRGLSPENTGYVYYHISAYWQVHRKQEAMGALRYLYALSRDVSRAADESILARARERGLLEIALHNPRDVTTDRHHIVDDYPYGGGAGMVMKPEPLFTAVEAARALAHRWADHPAQSAGARLQQEIARALAGEPRLR